MTSEGRNSLHLPATAAGHWAPAAPAHPKYDEKHAGLRAANAFFFGLCAALAGCATAPAGPAVTPEAGVAIVVGWGNTAGEAAKLVLQPLQDTLVSTLHVSKVNQQKIAFGQNIARVPPGKYELTIACGIYVRDRFFPSDSVIHAELVANQVYRLRAQPQARKCYPYLENATVKK